MPAPPSDGNLGEFKERPAGTYPRAFFTPYRSRPVAGQMPQEMTGGNPVNAPGLVRSFRQMLGLEAQKSDNYAPVPVSAVPLRVRSSYYQPYSHYPLAFKTNPGWWSVAGIGGTANTRTSSGPSDPGYPIPVGGPSNFYPGIRGSSYGASQTPMYRFTKASATPRPSMRPATFVPRSSQP